jgi:hypothetical protein
MRDLANNIGAVLALSPAVQAATIKGSAIDLLGFESAAIVINTGAIAGAGDFTAKLQESDTTTDGDFTDVAAGHLIGSLPASLEADSTVKQGYRGFKRYIRVVLTKNSGTSIAAGAVAVKGHAHLRPVA